MAVSGTHVVLLSWDLPPERLVGLLGFAVRRRRDDDAPPGVGGTPNWAALSPLGNGTGIGIGMGMAAGCGTAELDPLNVSQEIAALQDLQPSPVAHPSGVAGRRELARRPLPPAPPPPSTAAAVTG